MNVTSAFSSMHRLAARLWRRLGLVADDPGIEQDWLRLPTPPPQAPARDDSAQPADPRDSPSDRASSRAFDRVAVKE